MKSEFKKLLALIERNIKLYFKDKMIFFVSLLTPIILVVLFLTFLGKTYSDSLTLSMGADLANSLTGGVKKAFTGGWLFSSILATSCITVAFCSNMMVTDKVNKVNFDFEIAPVKKSTLQISYVISNYLTTVVICFVAIVIGFIYLGIVGFYLSFSDVMLLILNVMLLSLIGTLLSSIIWLFVSSQGALSAVCTLVSSMYGFICGAYMPISQFSNGIKNFVSLIPTTYSTVLFRKVFMNGTLKEMERQGVPSEALSKIEQSFDGTIDFFGTNVPTWAMYVILAITLVVLFTLYLILSNLKRKTKSQKVKKSKATIQ